MTHMHATRKNALFFGSSIPTSLLINFFSFSFLSTISLELSTNVYRWNYHNIWKVDPQYRWNNLLYRWNYIYTMSLSLELFTISLELS